MRNHDCDRLGLDRRQLAGLTGFTSRAAAALAHLRECWCIADETNRPGVERAIRALLCTRSLSGNPHPYALVLGAGLDPELARELLIRVEPPDGYKPDANHQLAF